jgi:N-acetylglucosamine kinase-like BadF-type ATPase
VGVSALPRRGGGPVVLAIDGGNSKTDVAVVSADGTLLGWRRGAGFQPSASGAAPAVALVAGLVEDALREAGAPPVALVKACLANADLPVEEEQLAAALAAHGWGPQVHVSNDTFAVLRAGTREPRGVAVVCGAGINCVGLLPDGRTARFLALGELTGDWGGGGGLAREVMWHAVRAEDGRGPATALAAAAAAHFGVPSALAVAEAVHLGSVPAARLHELAPVLFTVAEGGDEVALGLVARQAEEIVSLATIALARLGLHEQVADVVLGGGVLTARQPLLLSAVTAGLRRSAPRSRPVVLDTPPVVGAALLGLDDLASSGELTRPAVHAAEARLRACFSASSPRDRPVRAAAGTATGDPAGTPAPA